MEEKFCNQKPYNGMRRFRYIAGLSVLMKFGKAMGYTSIALAAAMERVAAEHRGLIIVGASDELAHKSFKKEDIEQLRVRIESINDKIQPEIIKKREDQPWRTRRNQRKPW